MNQTPTHENEPLDLPFSKLSHLQYQEQQQQQPQIFIYNNSY